MRKYCLSVSYIFIPEQLNKFRSLAHIFFYPDWWYPATEAREKAVMSSNLQPASNLWNRNSKYIVFMVKKSSSLDWSVELFDIIIFV